MDLIEKSNFNLYFFGYSRIKDFLKAISGFENFKIHIFCALFFSIISQIDNSLFENETIIYFIFVLLLVELILGVFQAFINKKFSLKKLPRIFPKTIIYFIILKYNYLISNYIFSLNWLSGFFFGIILSIILTGIIKNFILCLSYNNRFKARKQNLIRF